MQTADRESQGRRCGIRTGSRQRRWIRLEDRLIHVKQAAYSTDPGAGRAVSHEAGGPPGLACGYLSLLASPFLYWASSKHAEDHRQEEGDARMGGFLQEQSRNTQNTDKDRQNKVRGREKEGSESWWRGATSNKLIKRGYFVRPREMQGCSMKFCFYLRYFAPLVIKLTGFIRCDILTSYSGDNRKVAVKLA